MNVFPPRRNLAIAPRFALTIVATVFLLTGTGLCHAQTFDAGKENLSEMGRARNDKTLLAPPAAVLSPPMPKEHEFLLRSLKEQLNEAQAELKELRQNRIESTRMAEEAREFLKSNLKQMAESERAYALRMAEHQRNQKLPPIENGTVVVFKLQKYPAVDAARTLSSLLGAQPVRLAVDERTNSLIAFGKQETLPAVEELVRRLDEQDDASSDSQGTSKAKNSDEASRSLLVRVFWLADGVSADDGQDPAAFLPNSVLDATERLGLSNPRLVTQTVNSLAVKGDESIPFSTSVPALVGEAPVGLNCKGEVQLIGDDRAGVNVRIEVSGPISCSLSGSLASPLGHYMVLGTANSVISDAAQGAAMMDGPGMGMEGGMGRGGYGGEGRRGRGGMRGYGGEGGGYGGEMGIRSGKGEGVEGGTGMEGEAPASPAEQKYTTSRFAFVVQVIEGQSYPGEASTTDAHATETESGDDPIGRK